KATRLPSSCMRRASSMYRRVWPGSGTEVTRKFQSSPSAAAAASPASCSSVSGTSRMPRSSRMTGSTKAMSRLALSVVALHEHQLLEQGDVLLVLQERAHQWRNRDLF